MKSVACSRYCARRWPTFASPLRGVRFLTLLFTEEVTGYFDLHESLPGTRRTFA